jgi:hypothetical protein
MNKVYGSGVNEKNPWSVIYFLFGIIGIAGILLLRNWMFIWLFMVWFLPLIVWIFRGSDWRTTVNRTIDRFKRFQEFQTKIIFTIVLLVPIVIALISYLTIFVQAHQERVAQRIQHQWAIEEEEKKNNAPAPMIQMLTDLSWIIQNTWITLDYVVYNASVVYFDGQVVSGSNSAEYIDNQLMSPSSGVLYFRQFVPLPAVKTSVTIKGENKYRNNAQIFSIERKKNEQEIQEEKQAEKERIEEEKQAEKARIAEEKYKNSAAYKNVLLQGIADKLNSDVNGLAVDLEVQCQEMVRPALKSPSSADFPGSYKGWSAFTVKWGKIVTTSYVDAQNSFGAQMRMYFECIYQLDWDNNILLFDVKTLE